MFQPIRTNYLTFEQLMQMKSKDSTLLSKPLTKKKVDSFVLTNILCSIRTKTLFTIFLIFLIFYGIIVGIIVGIFSETYFQYEINGMNQAARRLNRVIKDIMDMHLNFLGQFNAIWTVSFNAFNKYFLDSNKADLLTYMNDNWAAGVFVQFEVEFIGYYWLHNGSLIITRTHNPSNNTLDTVPYPPSLSTLPSFEGIDFSATSTRAAGFLVEKDRNVTYLISAIPVQDNAFKGPVKAVALAGKRITSKVIADLSSRAQYCATMFHSNNKNTWNPSNALSKIGTGITPNMTVDNWQDRNIGFSEIMKPASTTPSALTGRQCWQGRTDENSTLWEERLAGFNIYNDLHGDKSVIFRIDVSRSINSLAFYSIAFVVTILAAVGLGFFILIGCLLETLVLFRMTSLTSQIRKIKESVDLTKRVGVLRGVDEVDYLTSNINEMLTNVEETQNQLKTILNKLGHEEEKTRLMLNSIPDGIAIVNPKNGSILEVNSMFEMLICQDWKSRSMFQIVPDLDRGQFESAVGKCNETVAIGMSNVKIPCQVTTCVIEFFEEGIKIPYVLVVIKDMRERNEALSKIEMGRAEFSKMQDRFTFEQEFGDPIIREAFTKFCKNEKCEENIYFLILIEDYKKLDQVSRSKSQKLVYNKYLSEKSKIQLNISPQAKINAEKKVSSGLGQIDLFSDLEKEVKNRLIDRDFKKFQKEKLKYIDDVLKERELRPKKQTSGYNRISENYEKLSFIPSETVSGRQASIGLPTINVTGKRQELDEDFDMSNYVISHDTIFNYKDIGDAFYELLKDEVNPEPWEFLMDVEKFEHLKSTKEKMKMMKEIYKTYIVDDAPKLLNISGVIKNGFIEKLTPQLSEDSWILDQSIESIFDEIKRIVKAEMLVDVFPRFSKSQFCSNVLEKYKNNPKVLLPKIAIKKSYNNDFVLDNIILDEDIDYFRRASEDTFDYEILTWNSSRIITTFFATHNYIPKVTLIDNIAVYKYDAVVPYPLEHVICSLAPLNNRLNYDSDFQYYREIEFVPFDKYNESVKEKYEIGLQNRRGIAVIESEMNFKDDSRNLKYSAAYTVSYDESTETYFVFSRPIVHRDFHQNLSEGIVDWNQTAELRNPITGKLAKHSLYFAITLQIFTKEGEGKTKFQQFNVISFDSKQKLNKKEKKNKIISRSKTLHQSMISTLLTNNNEYLTFENYRNELMEDSVGKLILESKNQLI